MVRPRRRGNRHLRLPGLSANPRLQRTRACGYSGSNPASALRSSPRPLPRHCVARPSSICFLCSSSCRLYLRVLFLSPTCESLSYASFIYLPPSYVTRIVCLARRSSICLRVRHSVARPFLSPTCESLHCASFIYLFVLRAFCLVVNRGRRGEERVSDSLASWEDKRMDVVASS
jgi:hypothetical protein